MQNITVITGASSGLGREFVELAAEAGHNIALVARSETKLEDIAQQLTKRYPSQTFTVYQADLSLPGEAYKMYKQISNHYHIDVLVNNAGIGLNGEVSQLDVSDTYDLIELNVQTVAQLAQLAASDMEQRGRGMILNVASLAGLAPGPGMSAYYASKAFVLRFSQSLHYELKPSSVHVSCLCPGPLNTDFAKHANLEDSQLFRSTSPANQVAQIGWEGMLKNKPTVYPGWRTKLSALGLRLAPTSLVAKITQRSHQA